MKAQEKEEALKVRIQALEQSIKEQQEKIEEQQKKIAEGEEAAMNRVCAALELNPAVIRSKEAKKEAEPLVDCFVPFQININGRYYRGKHRVPMSVFQVLSQAIGDHRMRIMRESIGDTKILELINGTWQSRLVESIGPGGERIA